MATTEAPNIIITLVHGTWGRKRLPFSAPNWFEPGSIFLTCFSQELESNGIKAVIQPFLWSGANSLYARSDASVTLASMIEKQAEKHPDVRHVVIGHSHGGSVALLAIQKLWTNVDPIVVTLATPFMEIVRSPVVGEEAKIKRYIATALPSVGLLIALGWLYSLLDIQTYNHALWSVNFFVIALRVLPALYGVGKVDPPNEFDWLSPSSSRSDIFQALTKGGATFEPPRRTLVIRGIDDEAGMVLAFGSIANRLMSLAPAWTITLTYFGICICLSASGLILLGRHFASLNAGLAPIVSTVQTVASKPYIAYPAIFSIAVFFLFPVISGVFKSVYGRELILGGVFCDIMSASAPDAASKLTIATLPPTPRRGLRHGIYNHEMTPRVIAKFLSAAVEAPPPSAQTLDAS
ncbi:esterase/lipase family protein [Bradyrhizobium sp. CCBAU 11434]|uniref:esterase/lipase family protein n=1 Tax=Bradyrhizobium sp. CCBAU 11434 TaxID=1630885 RepID=UPI002305A68D|nr:hypothetical protein [Bradyrhizobium sp. CCBAU 11434]